MEMIQNRLFPVEISRPNISIRKPEKPLFYIWNHASLVSSIDLQEFMPKGMKQRQFQHLHREWNLMKGWFVNLQSLRIPERLSLVISDLGGFTRLESLTLENANLQHDHPNRIISQAYDGLQLLNGGPVLPPTISRFIVKSYPRSSVVKWLDALNLPNIEYLEFEDVAIAPEIFHIEPESGGIRAHTIILRNVHFITPQPFKLFIPKSVRHLEVYDLRVNVNFALGFSPVIKTIEYLVLEHSTRHDTHVDLRTVTSLKTLKMRYMEFGNSDDGDNEEDNDKDKIVFNQFYISPSLLHLELQHMALSHEVGIFGANKLKELKLKKVTLSTSSLLEGVKIPFHLCTKLLKLELSNIGYEHTPNHAFKSLSLNNGLLDLDISFAHGENTLKSFGRSLESVKNTLVRLRLQSIELESADFSSLSHVTNFEMIAPIKWRHSHRQTTTIRYPPNVQKVTLENICENFDWSRGLNDMLYDIKTLTLRNIDCNVETWKKLGLGSTFLDQLIIDSSMVRRLPELLPVGLEYLTLSLSRLENIEYLDQTIESKDFQFSIHQLTQLDISKSSFSARQLLALELHKCSYLISLSFRIIEGVSLETYVDVFESLPLTLKELHLAGDKTAFKTDYMDTFVSNLLATVSRQENLVSFTCSCDRLERLVGLRIHPRYKSSQKY